jgi:class 3 adenylate cyclase/predicted ATPase
MTFEEILVEARALLEREGRIAYRILKRRFDLSDDDLEDLKADLIDAKRVAVDEEGKVLVWNGAASVSDSKFEVSSFPPPTHELRTQNPELWTPPHLAERIRAEQVALEARGATDGERKTITALFADLKGSTALIEGLDPEEARAIIDPALQLMMDAVHRYEGYVAQALGDGIFALFGAPIAHEDHPQRALYAALRMQEEMRRYSDALRRTGRAPLQMRVGVNTGEVVVRSIRKDDLHTDYVPVGHSTNLAARMEQLANPGSILVTAHTQRLTEGYFEFKALGETRVKGAEAPLNVYEVLGAGPLRTRFQVSVTRRGLTRFVGRHGEMEQLQRALEQAKAGHGQIVGVMGEPGLGKSRLLYEFKLLSQSGCLLLEAYSVSHGKASPYLPVIELLKDYFQIQPQDDERTRRQKVIGKVLELDRGLENTLPYFFALLGSEEQPSPLQQMDAQIRRQRTFDAIKQLFLRESLKQPLILVFEDLHWIDSETQGFLDTLSESMASARVLLLTNYRPEYRHEWGQKTYYTQLRLAPFGKAEAEEFLEALLGIPIGVRHASPLQPLKQLILEKTEGTPFFMEEIVQELREQGVLPGVGATHASPLPTNLQIPPTVQGILAARIDRLAPDEKALLQQLAVIGREFPLSLLRQVITQPEEELYRLLSSLQHKEFLYEQPAFPEVEYIFKHALTQEVAYGTVLHERRKALHERTAQAIEALYHTNLEDHYSDLAHHYSRSGNAEKAADYLSLAGRQAMRRSVYAEAIEQLTLALQSLNTLPDTAKRARQELTVQVALGTPLVLTRGYADPAAEAAFLRARELSEQLGDNAQLAAALVGLWRVYGSRGDQLRGREIAEETLYQLRNDPDSPLVLAGYVQMGASEFWLGNTLRAHELLARGAALYEPQKHRPLTASYGVEIGMATFSNLADALWYLGYPGQAERHSLRSLAIAQEVAFPFTTAVALDFAARRHQFLRDPRAAQERAEAAIVVSKEHGLSYRLALATMIRGWAVAEQGSPSEGIRQIQQGLAACHTMGIRSWTPYYSSLLAEAYSKENQHEQALLTLHETLAVVEQTGEVWWLPEIYRLKGELTLQKELSVASSQLSEAGTVGGAHPTKETEAEGYFLKAIAIAQRQQAKSLELRATVSLARLWQQQGKIMEARQRLAEIYNWFTEGFDTKDLQEAKALLDELS